MNAAVCCHCVCNSTHCMLTNTKVDVAACIIVLAVISAFLDVCLVRRCKVSRAAEETRHNLCKAVYHLAGEITCSVCLVFKSPEFVRIKSFHIELTGHKSFPLFCKLRILLCVIGEELVPFVLVLVKVGNNFLHMSVNFVCHEELFCRHLKVFFKLCKLFCTESLTVNLACSCIRSAVTDFGCNFNKSRLILLCLCLVNRSRDNIGIVAVCNRESLPAICFKACTHIFCKCNIGASFNCYGV